MTNGFSGVRRALSAKAAVQGKEFQVTPSTRLLIVKVWPRTPCSLKTSKTCALKKIWANENNYFWFKLVGFVSLCSGSVLLADNERISWTWDSITPAVCLTKGRQG